MADEPNTNGTEDTLDNKVEFTPEQQAKVQSLIDAAVGRVANKVRSEESVKLTTLQSELDAAKAAAKAAKTPAAKVDAADEVTALKAQIDEIKGAAKANADEANRWKGEAQTARDLAKTAREEANGVRKQVAMTAAASKIPFVNLDVVTTLTNNQIHQDADGNFVILREDGQPRLNASMEPMTLEEFYNDFASKMPYLVRGDIKSGTGSSEASRSAYTGNKSYEVTQIFGPKSDSRLANELAKSNIAEYRRLRVIAKSQGLVV